jgi:hypothetical protein
MGLLERYGWEFVGPLGWWLSLKPDEQAAWVAAIGALAAIAVTQRIAGRQQRVEADRQRKTEEIATRRYADHALGRMTAIDDYLQGVRALVQSARPFAVASPDEAEKFYCGDPGTLAEKLIPDSDDVEYIITGAAYSLEQARTELTALISRHSSSEYDPARSAPEFWIANAGKFVSDCEPVLIKAETRAATLRDLSQKAIDAPWPAR